MTVKTIAKNISTAETSPMAELLEKEGLGFLPKVGDLVDGRVIAISRAALYVDLRGLATGVVRGPGLNDPSGQYSDLKIGDEVSATVIDLENENGELELSFQFAGQQKAWDKIITLMKTGEALEAKVINANKGGLMLKIGNMIGFLPVSQLTVEHYPRVEGGDKNKILEKLHQLMNQNLYVKVIDVNPEEEKLILSEKAATNEKRQTQISVYKVGDVIEGRVSGVADFGAFVEFGEGLEGLVHISELAWQRLDDPHDVIKVGQTVKAEVIAIENNKISLSLKKLLADPWKNAAKKYQVGQAVKGKVLKINPFGIFVELDPEIHGLAHISELSAKPIKSPVDHFKVGEMLDFKIMSIEPKDHRLGLSIKALKPDASAAEAKTETNETKEPTVATDAKG